MNDKEISEILDIVEDLQNDISNLEIIITEIHDDIERIAEHFNLTLYPSSISEATREQLDEFMKDCARITKEIKDE